jgi:hypothetical protein
MVLYAAISASHDERLYEEADFRRDAGILAGVLAASMLAYVCQWDFPTRSKCHPKRLRYFSVMGE